MNYRIKNFAQIGVVALTTALFTFPAHAGNMNAGELEKMMSGNSIYGMFPDGVTAYRQNNHADGVAVVVVKNDKIRNIPWEVIEVEGTAQYCEDWSADGWGKLCYTAVRDNLAKPVFTDMQGNSNPQNWVEGFIDLNHPE